MRKDEAMQHALGYAAGREDASGIPTNDGGTGRPGMVAFADAFARAWDEYNRVARYYMTTAESAYDCWQSSNGGSIFREGQPTVSKV